MPSAALRVSLPDRYRVVRHVANGGMGAVYAAEDGLLGRPVAIKVLASHLAEDPINRERFQREARAAARLSNHPNVVTVYDVGEHDGRPFLVMELMECGSVAHRIRGGRIRREDALEWLAGAAAALDFGHEHGVVHRDVKPANLLLDGNGKVHVADFGIARIATEETLTSTDQVLGTAAYLSPEQVLGRSATAASDLYSLAVVAFELLTGRRPFTGEHLAAQARQHVEAPPPAASEIDPELPKALDDVLKRGLAKDPDDRWPTAQEMVQELRTAVVGPRTAATRRIAPRPARAPAPAPAAAAKPTPAPPPPRTPTPSARAASTTPPPPVGASGRRRILPFALAGLLALVLAGIAIAVFSGGSSSDQTASTPAAKTTPKAKSTPSDASTPTSSAPSTGSAPSSSASSSSSASGSSGSGSGGASASALQLRGHAMLLGGDPKGAIPVLRRSLDATGKKTDDCLDPSGTCLTYAYALFDLGQAYRLSGQKDQAVSTLKDRLRIRNQRAAVQRELDLAEKGSKQKG